VPAGGKARLRVGDGEGGRKGEGGGEGNTRAWKMNEVFFFDDSFEHEVWNDAESARAVLIVDVWHPQLSLAERDSVRAHFEFRTSGGGGRRAQQTAAWVGLGSL